MEKMRGIQIVKPEALRVIEMAVPELNPTDNVLGRIRAAGICGSDVGIYHGTNAAATYPLIIGHEMVGEVVETAPTAKKVKVGDRVIIDQVKACGQCWACRHNRPNVCQRLQVRGVHIDGGYREYMAVPDADCYLLPEGLRYEDAVLIEPTTIALQACARAQIAPDDEVLILGVGALGSRMLSIARLSGARIIVADVVEERLREALESGADCAINLQKEDLGERLKACTTDAYGPTLSIDCACTKDSLGTLIRVAGNAGRIITMGFSVAPTEVTNFGITSKELDIRGSRLQNRKFQAAIDLIREGKIDLDHKISHTYHYLDAQKAFDFIDTKDPSIRKIVLTFD